MTFVIALRMSNETWLSIIRITIGLLMLAGLFVGWGTFLVMIVASAHRDRSEFRRLRMTSVLCFGVVIAGAAALTWVL